LIYQAYAKPNPGLDKTESGKRSDPETEEYSDEKADSTELAEELLLLYQEEGLDGALARPYDNLVLAWGRTGDVGREKVREFARLGVQEAGLWPGEGSVEMKRFLKALE
jgi:predicted DNA-binding WGR domain protein